MRGIAAYFFKPSVCAFSRICCRRAAYAFNSFSLNLLLIPHLTSLILPLGLFLGILIALGKLYADSEMIVLISCGFSNRQLLKIVSILALLIAGVVALNTLWLGPIINGYKQKILSEAESASAIQTIMPGRFQVSGDGKRVFYIEAISRDRNHLENIFVADRSGDDKQPEKTRWEVMSAQSGQQVWDQTLNAPFLVASNGNRYIGKPGEKDYRIVNFGSYGVRIQDKPLIISNEADSLPTWALWLLAKKHSLNAMAELQWRIALPISTFLLAFLGLALCRVSPRQGRFSKIFLSILIYIIYSNMLFVGRAWLEKGVISPVLGLWWIHLAFLILTAILLLNYLSWPRSLVYYFRS